MSEITNNRFISGYQGCSRFTVPARSITTGIASLFTIKLSMYDKGITYNTDTLLGKKANTSAFNVCTGKVGGLIKGEQTYEEKTLDLSFGDDYNLAVNDVDATVARNLLKALMDGTSFKFGGDTYVVIGTNGTDNAGRLLKEQDFGIMFREAGKVITPDSKNADGSMATETNNFVTAYDTNTMGMIEFKYAFGTNAKGDRFVYFLSESCTFNEGSSTDANKYSVSGTRYCDYRNIDKYFVEGNSYATELATSGADALYEVNADIIIELAIAGAGSTVPTVDGTDGQQAVVINSNDGTIHLYKHNGTSWNATAVTSTLAVGCNIFAPSVDTVLTGASAVAKNARVTVKTAGTSGNAVAVNWFVDSTGSGSDTYVCDIYDWDYATQTFVNFQGE